MICRFCAQVNAEPAKRCCFCHNLLGATEDQTAIGRVTAAQHGLARMPGKTPSPSPGMRVFPKGEPELERHGRTLDKAGIIWAAVIAVGVALWMYFKAKFGF